MYVAMDARGDEKDLADTLHFSLLLEKSLSSQVEIASWNPGKDLLAMVSKDHQLVVHRLNWQRLWAVTPDLDVTAICWRPDAKALAVGHSNGRIAIHDVENGDVLRTTQTHDVAVRCLYWAERNDDILGCEENVFIYEDRTPRFFPKPPRPPPMPGTVPSAIEYFEESNPKGTTRHAKDRLDILCSGDQDGLICLSAFGVFPIGKLDTREFKMENQGLKCHSLEKSSPSQLLNARAVKVSLSNDLRNMTVVCSANTMTGDGRGPRDARICCISVDTGLLGDRCRELRQVAIQASSVEELLDVLLISVTVMAKHWSEAIVSVTDKFSCGFLKLLSEHGSSATPQDELLALLTCGYASPALSQFLATSLGEGGLKRLSKTVDSAARELHDIIFENLQPAAEIMAFRLGELRCLSRWHGRFDCVGLREILIDQALEHAGNLLVQLEHLLRIISDTTGGFRLFFSWLVKVLRQLNRDTSPHSEQQSNVDNLAVAHFIQTDLYKDPIGPRLSRSSDEFLEVPWDLREMMDDVTLMGGYADSNFFHRTVAEEADLLTHCCREAFLMPSKVVSPQLGSPRMVFLCRDEDSRRQPLSMMYFEVTQENIPSLEQKGKRHYVEYVCFQENSNPQFEDSCVVGILRRYGAGLWRGDATIKTRAEAIILQLDKNLHCVDLSLYKERKILLLVTDQHQSTKDMGGRAWLMLLQLDDLYFHQLPTSLRDIHGDLLHQCSLSGAVKKISLRDGKVRALLQPDAVVIPLTVSASRGLACVFTSPRHVLLFDLEEDDQGKDENSD